MPKITSLSSPALGRHSLRDRDAYHLKMQAMMLISAKATKAQAQSWRGFCLGRPFSAERAPAADVGQGPEHWSYTCLNNTRYLPHSAQYYSQILRVRVGDVHETS